MPKRKVRKWKIEVELWDTYEIDYLTKKEVKEILRRSRGGLEETRFKNLKIRRIK